MSSHVTENNVGTRVHIPDSESQDGTWRRRIFVGSLRIQRETWIHHHTHADCTSQSRGPLRRRLPYPRQRQQRHVTYGDRGRSQHSLSRRIVDDVAKDLAIPWRAWQSTAKSVAGAGLKRRRGLAAAVTSRFPTACGVALLGGRRRRAEIRAAGYGRCHDPVGQAPGRRVGWLAGWLADWRGGAQPTHRDTKKKKEKIAPLMR